MRKPWGCTWADNALIQIVIQALSDTHSYKYSHILLFAISALQKYYLKPGHARERGDPWNRKRIQRLMRIMGIRGVAPGPDTSKPHPENKVYSYLLRGMTIDKVNQVWSTDITYICVIFVLCS
jgi:transposase InsO family protein